MTSGTARVQARDLAIEALLPFVAEHGWSAEAVRLAAGPQVDLLFPGGPAEMVETYIDRANRLMAAEAAPLMATQKLSQRVRTLIVTRLAQAQPYRLAVRRAVAILALPGNAATAARCTARTVDAIWIAAGDTSADFSWYTKRAILASVYTSTLLYWLNDETEGEASLAFLDRRLKNVAQIGKLRSRLSSPKAA